MIYIFLILVVFYQRSQLAKRNRPLRQAKIITKTFDTPLGSVVCGVVSDCNKMRLVGQKKYENGHSEIFETVGYQIELIEFKIKQPLYNGLTITDSCGWIWKIEKRNNKNEALGTFCLFEQPTGAVQYSPVCGEHLDAVEICNENWSLCIGTEDGEVLNGRAEYEDEFPKRFNYKVNLSESITRLETNGLKTQIPELDKGEILHLQYLVAYDKSENDNSWLAVDEDKQKLEDWIGIEQ